VSFGGRCAILHLHLEQLSSSAVSGLWAIRSKTMKTPLIERMQKGGAAKVWIKEVEAKDRTIELLSQKIDEYLNIIDALASEREQLENG